MTRERSKGRETAPPKRTLDLPISTARVGDHRSVFGWYGKPEFVTVRLVRLQRPFDGWERWEVEPVRPLVGDGSAEHGFIDPYFVLFLSAVCIVFGVLLFYFVAR